MKFGIASRWRKWQSGLPEWVTLAAPTVAVVSGTSLAGVLPAVIVAGARYMGLLVVAACVPLALLLIMALLLAMLLPRETGPSGGGDGPPPPPDDPPDGPPWWPSFEKAFRQHVRENPAITAGTPSRGGDHRGVGDPAAPVQRGRV